MRTQCLVALSTVCSLLVVSAVAEIPQLISYQGKVTDSDGTPVVDGSYAMRFRIYDVPTGGTVLWDSGVRSITVRGGIFSIMMGESPQPAMALDFSADYWLLVTFDGANQTPRQRLGSVGYAYMASGVVAGTEVSGEVTGGTSAALKGSNTDSTGATYGIWGVSASTAGVGLYGTTSATSGITHGVFGASASTEGRGISGVAWATEGATYGVGGSSLSTDGMGVMGIAWATSGTTYGVYGQNYSTSDGFGVYGYASATMGWGCGVYGLSTSPDGAGVVGAATATYGGCGGTFLSLGSAGSRGVYGWAQASSGTTIGVYGRASSSTGHGVYFQGGLAGTGAKSCVVKTSQGPTLMYCQESPENWFEDFGEGQLVNGRCHIELDPLFLETVTIDEQNPMKVFVELGGKCRWVYVQRGSTGFDVIEQDDGTSNVGFCYRVVAKRKGFEEKRLDYCAAAERDSYLYPELREKERFEHETRNSE